MDVNYVLYGEEAALIRKKISNIAKKASLATDRISTYDALQTPLKVVLEDVSTMPFFEENKMVVVMNCTFLSSKDTTGYALDALLTYLRDPLPSTILILCCECAKLDQRKRVVKEIVSCCESMVCSRISDHDKETVIKDLIREYNIKIDQEALQLLVQRLPLDVGIIEKIDDHKTVFVTGSFHFCRQTICSFEFVTLVDPYGDIRISDIKSK